MTNMTDITFTQTTKSMTSKPLNRHRGEYRPWSEIVREHNKLPKVITLRKNGVKVKVITGCIV